MNSKNIKGNRHKFLEGKFELYVKKPNFTRRLVKHWNKFSGGAEETSVLEKDKI